MGRTQSQPIDGRPSTPSSSGKPKSVLACEQDRWCLALTPLDLSAGLHVMPFRCQSWRCARCRWGRNQDDAELIAQIIRRNGGPEDWVYTVLTFDQRGCFGGPSEAYARIYDQFRNLTKCLRRRYADVQWISTLEQHFSGWPHINVLFRAPSMVERFAEAPYKLRDDIRRLAVQSGFGRILTRVEPIEGVEAISGYLVKIADGSTRVAGEMSKPSQLPIAAPPRTRRLRISGGLERPEKREKLYTGRLHRVPSSEGERRLEDASQVERTNCALNMLLDHAGDQFTFAPLARHTVASGAIVDGLTGEIHFSPDPGARGPAPGLVIGKVNGPLNADCPP